MLWSRPGPPCTQSNDRNSDNRAVVIGIPSNQVRLKIVLVTLYTVPNRGSSSGTNGSGRPNSRHIGFFSADDVMRICSCGCEIMLRTSWTTTNPGRRFRACLGNQGTYCEAFQWVDPTMCCRSKEVIPRLLNRLNQYDAAIKRAKECLDNAQMRRRNCHRLLFLVVFCWACSLLALHAINCALRNVNKTNDTKVTYPLACSRVTKLHERLTVFMWVINRPDVVWNRNLRFVTAVDSVWRKICRENKLARCYVNAYEDLLEELCMLFGVPVENEEAPPVDPPAEDAPLVAFGADAQPLEGWVDPAPVAIEGAPAIQPVVHVISDSSDSSSSLWRFIDDYYGSDDDADSILPPPGVPTSISKKNFTARDKSPSGHS
ncbi:hypothetical protein Salat_1180700 [Sesamum alatum]|uniref:GRF-type domain-containing protein n=1 Tax=Sesamum alatum TaxID=300844 RepID=A0AAE2CNL2_9LAMI|nr:hypothetical protein Salat_1180700 [Sesamum alatum]